MFTDIREKKENEEWDLKEDFLKPIFSIKEGKDKPSVKIISHKDLFSLGEKVLMIMNVAVGKNTTWGKFSLKVSSISEDGNILTLEGKHFTDGYGNHHTVIQDFNNPEIGRKISFAFDKRVDYGKRNILIQQINE